MKDFFNGLFPNRFIINLDKRPDRLADSNEVFNMYSIPNVQRYSAVDGSLLENPYGINNGELGAVLSHSGLFKHCLANNLDDVLIFEDDVDFICETDYNFQNTYDGIPDDWQMIMLGGNYLVGCLSHVRDNIYRTNHAYALQSYIIRKPFMEAVVQSVSTNINCPIDVVIGHYMSVLPTYVLAPVLTTQRTNFSDIQQQECDYYFLKYGHTQ
jgi:GR25 family glycosyltransferase involved in LPS biosynthesis